MPFRGEAAQHGPFGWPSPSGNIGRNVSNRRMDMLAVNHRSRAVALIVAVVALSGIALTVRAGDASYDKMPSSYGAMMKMKPMDVFKMMDTDKKGVVTKEQYMKFHEAMFDKMDKNKDGVLSHEEWVGQIHTAP
jgi:hypothetical protein